MRLRETLLRFVYCIMNIEYKRKLCNNEYAVDIFVHAGKFDMPALAGVGCMGPHENADPRAVDERDAAKIDDQLAVFTVDEACNRAAYFVRFFSPVNAPLTSIKPMPPVSDDVLTAMMVYLLTLLWIRMRALLNSCCRIGMPSPPDGES